MNKRRLGYVHQRVSCRTHKLMSIGDAQGLDETRAQKIVDATQLAVSSLIACISQLGVCFPQQRLQTSELLVNKSAANIPFISTKDRLHELSDKGIQISSMASNHNSLLQSLHRNPAPHQRLSLLVPTSTKISIYHSRQSKKHSNCTQELYILENDSQPLLLDRS